MLGNVQTVSGIEYVAALALVLTITALWVRLQGFVARLRAAQTSSRWASNVRDLIGLAGLSGLGIAFHLCGVPWPAAALFAGTMGILLELLRLGRRARPARTMLVALTFAAAIAVWPHHAVDQANAVADALFNGSRPSRPY